MGRLQVRQIERALHDELYGLINVDDVSSHPAEEKSKIRLSRALAAFVLVKMGNFDPAAAAASVTDGPGDNGIDAVALIPDEPRIILVQSKFAADGQGGAGLDDMIKYRDGLNDFLEMNWHKFNNKLRARENEIEELLFNPVVRIDVFFAHTGRSDIAPVVAEKINDFILDVNDPTEVAQFHYLGQSQLHSLLVADHQAQSINLEVELSDWGQVEGPPQAIYGQVSAYDVATWLSLHGEPLLARNVRVVLSDSEVNNSLVASIDRAPTNFWYLNNGITVLCERIVKAPAGGTDRRVGNFSFQGSSIVNGAQTAGSLKRVLSLPEGEEKLKAARVMVRFISLEEAPDEFGNLVTRATNTQNRIGGRDFLSLDPEQARLRDEFQIDGLLYVFRSGEADPDPAAGCSVAEAAVALACSTSTPALAVQAKREISRLWDDTSKAPYKQLFNSGTTYLRVWRCVQIMRAVDTTLIELGKVSGGRKRGVAVHGNRLILHLVFKRIAMDRIDDPSEDWSANIREAEENVSPVLDIVTEVSERDFPGYPASLFKNAAKCATLSKTIMQALEDDSQDLLESMTIVATLSEDLVYHAIGSIPCRSSFHHGCSI